ncbi:hypothetical protein GYMLUDRAFT_248578 [Collybiopsis luxurians FD-317 M1]|uniref:Uncharacterized protein n=1 Tax=Collybiopsis luxurians FD-317 M1 TaxID=944289 RepID=A0A0D0AY51_9AGAR|nr:hypothetical protein GYMLUDRAFT_248578 [Collybiopsis luxurians FD-317 M1]
MHPVCLVDGWDVWLFILGGFLINIMLDPSKVRQLDAYRNSFVHPTIMLSTTAHWRQRGQNHTGIVATFPATVSDSHTVTLLDPIGLTGGDAFFEPSLFEDSLFEAL